MDREEADQCRKMHELVERHSLGPNFRWVGGWVPGLGWAGLAVLGGWEAGSADRSCTQAGRFVSSLHPPSGLPHLLHHLPFLPACCAARLLPCRWLPRRTGCATGSSTATLRTLGAPLRSPRSTRVGGGGPGVKEVAGCSCLTGQSARGCSWRG